MLWLLPWPELPWLELCPCDVDGAEVLVVVTAVLVAVVVVDVEVEVVVFDAHASIVSPCAMCACTAGNPTVIVTNGFVTECVWWQSVTFCCPAPVVVVTPVVVEPEVVVEPAVVVLPAVLVSCSLSAASVSC